MNISKLKPEAQEALLRAIFNGLTEHAKAYPEEIEAVLQPLVDVLDELNCDDFFGTEGWQHAFGIED